MTPAADAIPVIAQNPQVVRRQDEVVELQRESEACWTNTATSIRRWWRTGPLWKTPRRQLDIETAKAVQSVRNEYETALLRGADTRRALEGAKADAQDLRRKSVGYNVMEREAKSNHQVYEALLQQEKELQRREQQPHEQHPHRRSRRGAESADDAPPAAHLADGGFVGLMLRSRSRSASTT